MRGQKVREQREREQRGREREEGRRERMDSRSDEERHDEAIRAIIRVIGKEFEHCNAITKSREEKHEQEHRQSNHDDEEKQVRLPRCDRHQTHHLVEVLTQVLFEKNKQKHDVKSHIYFIECGKKVLISYLCLVLTGPHGTFSLFQGSHLLFPVAI